MHKVQDDYLSEIRKMLITNNHDKDAVVDSLIGRGILAGPYLFPSVF
jgi:hypothetical protein